MQWYVDLIWEAHRDAPEVVGVCVSAPLPQSAALILSHSLKIWQTGAIRVTVGQNGCWTHQQLIHQRSKSTLVMVIIIEKEGTIKYTGTSWNVKHCSSADPKGWTGPTRGDQHSAREVHLRPETVELPVFIHPNYNPAWHNMIIIINTSWVMLWRIFKGGSGPLHVCSFISPQDGGNAQS